MQTQADCLQRQSILSLCYTPSANTVYYPNWKKASGQYISPLLKLQWLILCSITESRFVTQPHSAILDLNSRLSPQPHLLSLSVTSAPLLQIHRTTWSPPSIFSFFTSLYFKLYLFGTPKSQAFWFLKVNLYLCSLFSLRLWHLKFNLLIIDKKY